MLGALVGGLASIVGGNKARRDERKAIREQNEYNAPVNVRARAEAAGFNPLLFVGPGVGQQNVTGGSNYMGSAIASAGLALADGMDKAKMLEIERSRLAMEREKLDTLVQNATLRPRSGGIYAGNLSAPSAGGVGGSGNVGNVRGNRAADHSDKSFRLSYSEPQSVPVPLASSVQDYVTSTGQRVSVPVGPDLDEVVSGAAIEMQGAWKKHANRVYDTEKYSFGSYLNKAAEGFFMSWPGLAVPYMLADEKPGEYDAAVKRNRAKAVERYKKDKAAGKIPPLQYIKPLR